MRVIAPAPARQFRAGAVVEVKHSNPNNPQRSDRPRGADSLRTGKIAGNLRIFDHLGVGLHKLISHFKYVAGEFPAQTEQGIVFVETGNSFAGNRELLRLVSPAEWPFSSFSYSDLLRF
jgi:hypothetical protein